MKTKDVKGVITRQKRYSTLAKKEGEYAKHQEKHERAIGLPEMAKDSAHEAEVAFDFASKRKSIVKKEEKKLPKKMRK